MSYETPEQHVGHCYSLRCLKHFAEFFGLVEIEKIRMIATAGNFACASYRSSINVSGFTSDRPIVVR
ncbi:MAG: hypothetical protein K0A93_09085 [Desulfuromonadaceae bacterium]|nr:hypothetical protein [Desulfuromonadaceae bacterium]